jgi:hypothetical protein
VGDGSPGSREAEGEGSEGFYVAQSGRCPDLLVIWGKDSAHVDAILPFLFWRVSLGRRSPRSGERQMSRGDPWVRPGVRPSPVSHRRRAYIAAAWTSYFRPHARLLAISQVCDKTATALSADDLIHIVPDARQTSSGCLCGS